MYKPMNTQLKRKVLRATALILLFSMGLEIIVPTAAYALTSGPASPEFSSFEPVTTTNMVNTFTGDFTYNLPVLQIPGPDGGGYAMSLAYHSGANSEEEASWVGYGWTLNPGSINRHVRGFPDDYSNTTVKQFNKMPVNWTTSATALAGLKYFSVKEAIKKSANAGETKAAVNFSKLEPSINYLRTMRYNNYKGMAAFYGIGGSAYGAIDLGFHRGAQGSTWEFGVNLLSLFKLKKKLLPEHQETAGKMENELTFGQKWRRSVHNWKNQAMYNVATKPFTTSFGMYTFAEQTKNVSSERYNGANYSLETGFTKIPVNFPAGYNVGLKGAFNVNGHQETDSTKVNGYMYSQSNQNHRNDYYVEKSTPYNKRDVYLGIPFNNADQYMVNGEGLTGGFRYHQKKLGHFLPAKTRNVTAKKGLGVEFSAGVTVGVGVNIALGDEKSEMTDWRRHNGDRFSFNNEGLFRFNGDKGGVVEYNDTIDSELYAPVLFDKAIDFPASLADELNDEKLSNSSAILFHQEANHGFDQSEVKGLSQNINPENQQAITELQVTNKGGVRYTYGVPVFNRNESNFQIDANSPDARLDKDEFLIYRRIALAKKGLDFNMDINDPMHNYANSTVIGEIKNEPYASNYLLTSIVTPDYVEVGNDGPDRKDFGGWTKFDYHKKYGAAADEASWYRWRIPYNGMFYDQGQSSDFKSRTATLSTGEKEVYYLKTIETKTHMAYFVTNKSDRDRWNDVRWGTGSTDRVAPNSPHIQGSGQDRMDGLGAFGLTDIPDPAAYSDGGSGPLKGEERLEYLEKIVLFSKKDPYRPLQVVHFDYDYSLVQNLPNHDEGAFPKQKTALNSGKLTLKKVWFEFGGVSTGRTSPYEFTYKYKVKNEFAQEVRDEYPEIVNEMSDKHGEDAQNPDYAPYYLDAWGNIQIDGAARKRKKNPWIDQRALSADDHKKFDPAAWQLKQIRLPSGGEILVQYEQKEYSFVQNRRPMVMATMLEANDSDESGNEYGLNPSYVLDPQQMGLSSDPTELDRQVELMTDYFVTEGEKIYFKFLYDLYEDGLPQLNDCGSEYVTGYAAVRSVEKVTMPDGSSGIKVTLDGSKDDNGRASVPRQACYDFYTTNRHQFDCYGTDPFNQQVYARRGELLSGNMNMLSQVTNQFNQLLKKSFTEGIPKKEDVGKTMSTELSYLRVPMIKAKRGGGVRVKRLLMYDEGIENGDPNLYGQEFIYEDFLTDDNGNVIEKISSGVALNEPSGARSENPLVRYLPRKGQTWYSKLSAGLDRKQFEGPIGESILPAAAIGHSRVIVQNIHQGATGTGYAVNDYHTAREHPYDKIYVYGDENPYEFLDKKVKGVDKTALGGIRKRSRSLTLPLGIFYYSNKQTHLIQGYRFIINEMHGQIKNAASYMGNYDGNEPDQALKFAGQSYQYFQPGEQMRMLQPNGDITWDIPGKMTDVTMERRSVRNRNIDAELPVDLLATINIPIPIWVLPTLRFNYGTKRIATHVTSKVVRYPAMLKSVISYQDGITSESENLAYNPHTGEVMLTRTTDGFDGIQVNGARHDGNIYTLNLPASWKYNSMGRQYEKGQYFADRFNQLGASVGSVTTYGKEGNPFKVDGKWSMDQNIIGIGMQTFRKNWGTNMTDNIADRYGVNDQQVVDQLDRIWRQHKSYIYNDNVVSSDPKVDANNRIYHGGVIPSLSWYANDDWESTPPAFDNNWIPSGEVTAFSPHGNTLEEKIALDIYSAAHFDKEGILPTLVTQNARYEAVYFNSYEDPVFSKGGHSGAYGRVINSSDPALLLPDEHIVRDAHLSSKGGIMKLWVHHNYDQQELRIRLREADTGIEQAKEHTLNQIAQVGEWILFSGEIPGPDITVSSFDFVISNSLSGNLLVDDLKFQPVDAQTTCYVYDLKTLRLLTQFDDEHFGLFYQYNEEGKLIRNLIETERGMKTIQETQYNTPRKPRI